MKRSAQPQQPDQFDLFSWQRLPGKPSSSGETPPPLPLHVSHPAPAKPESTAKPQAKGEDEDLTEQARDLLNRLLLPAIAQKVSVVWNARLRTTAGRAYCRNQLIELNPALWDISEEEIDRTFLHELAHLVAYARAGRKRIEPHGPEWRQACADLGIAGEARCHDLPFERHRQKRKFAYVCPHCARELRRVKRIRKAAACYHCCQTYNGGRYHTKYQLVERALRELG